MGLEVVVVVVVAVVAVVVLVVSGGVGRRIFVVWRGSQRFNILSSVRCWCAAVPNFSLWCGYIGRTESDRSSSRAREYMTDPPSPSSSSPSSLLFLLNFRKILKSHSPFQRCCYCRRSYITLDARRRTNLLDSLRYFIFMLLFPALSALNCSSTIRRAQSWVSRPCTSFGWG